MFLLTQRLLEGSREFDIKRFIYASSSSLYGNQDEWPLYGARCPSSFLALRSNETRG